MTDQKFHHFSDWEDYPAGFYARSTSDEHINAARNVLANQRDCDAAMREVIADWPVSVEHNLTDRSQNRRAWLGQAACCIRTGASSASTKHAWWQLSKEEQDCANGIADSVIQEWELNMVMARWH